MQKTDGGTPNASLRSNQVGQVRALRTNPLFDLYAMYAVYIYGRALYVNGRALYHTELVQLHI